MPASTPAAPTLACICSGVFLIPVTNPVTADGVAICTPPAIPPSPWPSISVDASLISSDTVISLYFSVPSLVFTVSTIASTVSCGNSTNPPAASLAVAVTIADFMLLLIAVLTVLFIPKAILAVAISGAAYATALAKKLANTLSVGIAIPLLLVLYSSICWFVTLAVYATTGIAFLTALAVVINLLIFSSSLAMAAALSAALSAVLDFKTFMFFCASSVAFIASFTVSLPYLLIILPTAISAPFLYIPPAPSCPSDSAASDGLVRYTPNHFPMFTTPSNVAKFLYELGFIKSKSLNTTL